MDQNDPNMKRAAEDGDQTESQTAATEEEVSSSAAVYVKSQSFVDIANNTFRELCKSLESEQNKLMDLEERRKKLQEEMLRLKAEIEEEKQVYQMNLVQSVGETLKMLNAETTDEIGQPMNFQPLENCNEDENNSQVTQTALKDIKSDESTIEEQTLYIKHELQNVLEQCILEQSQSPESYEETSAKTKKCIP